MRRLLAFTALGAMLACHGTAKAQSTFSQQVVFDTVRPQNMWDSGSANTLSMTIPLTVSWGFDATKSSYRSVWTLGSFGGAIKAASTGRAGLEINASATTGKVDVHYPGTLTLSYPDPATLKPGQTFTLTTSWTVDPGATIKTHSPDAGVTVNTILKSDPLFLRFVAKAFSHNIFAFNMLDTSFNAVTPLFDSHLLASGTFSIQKDIVTGKYHQPVLELEGGQVGDTNDLTAGGQDDFLTFRGDFSNVVGENLGLGSDFFHGTKRKGYSYANAFLKWSLLDLYGEVSLGFGQEFKFSPTPKVNLFLTYGPEVTITPGTSVQLTMPPDGSPLEIFPSMMLDNQFTNRTSFKVDSGLLFDALVAEAGVKVSGMFTKSVTFKPRSTDKLAGANLVDYELYKNTFKLGGFQTQYLGSLTIEPGAQSPALHAVDHYYTVSSSTGSYRLDVNAPGLLDGCTGPSGFHVADYVGIFEAGFSFDVNGGGSFNFQGSGPAGTYTIPYSVTDGHGHYSSANIYVTVVAQ